MSAEIKKHHGIPTLFLDNKPIFDGLMWGTPPGNDGYVLKNCAHDYGETGVHLFTFDMGMGGNPADWVGPRPGSDSNYDFTALKKRFDYVIEADPKARFHLRVHLEAQQWWQKLYPEECELTSDGRRLCQSFASKIWRQQAKEYLRALVEYFDQVGLGERIIAYQTGAGGTGEWVKGAAMGGDTIDYSQPMKDHFNAWLKEKYQGNENDLRKAWASPYLAFDTVEVPSFDAQMTTKGYTFRDPKTERNVIDFYQCLGELCGDLVVDFCTTVKESTHGKALTGAFYGYLLELAWNSGFFADGNRSEFSGYHRSGHLGLWKVLESPNVDFLVSPYSYGFRGIGGEGSSMLPSETLKLHNKLYIFEEDSRTHITWHDHPNYGKVDTLEESITILKRNFAYVVTHGHGIWWLAGGGPKSPHIELSQQPAFRPLIKQFNEIGNLAVEMDRGPSAEIAVLLDDESFLYESIYNNLDIPLIFQQRLWGLPKIGAPYDTYLLNDFIEGRVKPYKLYIFLNAFHLNKERREKLKKEIRKEGRVALWIYGAGYLDEEGSLANMSDLTGFNFGMGEHPWGPMMNLIDFEHPITEKLSQDLFWGTNSLLAPIFHIADDGVRILGNVVYSEGRCRPGLGVKENAEWKSIYCAVPNIPAGVLRGMARYAGVHLYSEAGDVLYATKELLGVHTAGGGERVFRLPGKVEQVVELFSGEEIGRDTDKIRVKLAPASTVLYYTGRANR